MSAEYEREGRTNFTAVFDNATFLAEYGIPDVLAHNNFAGVVLAVSDTGFAAAEAELSRELGMSSGTRAGALLAQVQCRPCVGLPGLPPAPSCSCFASSRQGRP